MTRITAPPPPTFRAGRTSRRGDPVWEIAHLFPIQGHWTESQYLALDARRLVEFDNGMIEVLPLPTKSHQLMVLFLFEALRRFLTGRGVGRRVLVAPYRLRISDTKHREPDVLYLTPDQDARAGEEFTSIAELVMEVVSPDDPERDYHTKRRDYAEAGVSEYWIIDGRQRQVLVLRLEQGQYVEHGRFGPGQQAASNRLTGFAVSVDELLAPE